MLGCLFLRVKGGKITSRRYHIDKHSVKIKVTYFEHKVLYEAFCCWLASVNLLVGRTIGYDMGKGRHQYICTVLLLTKKVCLAVVESVVSAIIIRITPTTLEQKNERSNEKEIKESYPLQLWKQTKRKYFLKIIQRRL